MPEKPESIFKWVSFPPGNVDPLDIQPTGQLYSEAQLKWAQGLLKGKPGKYPMKEFPESPFSLLVVADPKTGKKRGFAIYEGKVGEGSFGGVKVGVDIETNTWVAIKIIPEAAPQVAIKKQRKQRPKAEDKDAEDTEFNEPTGTFEFKETSGTVEFKETSGITEINLLADEPLPIMSEIPASGELQILQIRGELFGQLTRDSPSKKVPQNCIVMQLARGHSLDKLQGLNDQKVLEIMRAVLTAFQQLIENDHILHRDIKLENIMYDGNTLYIIDLGLAIQVTPPNFTISDSPVGTPEWMAPEINKYLKLAIMDATFSEVPDLLKEQLENAKIIKELDPAVKDKSKSNELFQESVLNKYTALLQEKKNSLAEIIDQPQKALERDRPYHLKKLLNEYLEIKENKAAIIELLKTKPTSLDERKAFVDNMKVQLKEYVALLEEEKEKLEKQIQHLPANKDLIQSYLSELKSIYDGKQEELKEKVNKLKQTNIRNVTEHIEDFASYIQDGKSKQHEKIKWEELDTNFITPLDEHVKASEAANFDPISAIPELLKIIEGPEEKIIKDPKKQAERKLAASEKIQEIINKEADADSEDRKNRYKLLSKIPPVVQAGQMEYNAATEIYSVMLVLLAIVQQNMNQPSDLREELLKNFFLQWDWEKIDKRPTFQQAIESFLPIFEKYHHIESRPNNCLLVGSGDLLKNNLEIDPAKVEALLKSLAPNQYGEILLTGNTDIPFNIYISLREMLETNIPVRQEVLLLDKNISEEKINEEFRRHEKQTAEREISHLDRQIKNLGEIIADNEEELSKIDTEIVDANKKAMADKAEEDGKSKEITEIKAEIEKISVQLNNGKPPSTEEESQTKEEKRLKAQLIEKENKLKKLEIEKESANFRKNHYERKIESLETKKESLPKEKINLEKKIEGLEAQIKEIQRESQEKSIQYYHPKKVGNVADKPVDKKFADSNKRVSNELPTGNTALESPVVPTSNTHIRFFKMDADASKPLAENIKNIGPKESFKQFLQFTLAQRKTSRDHKVVISQILKNLDSPQFSVKYLEETLSRLKSQMRTPEFSQTIDFYLNEIKASLEPKVNLKQKLSRL